MAHFPSAENEAVFSHQRLVRLLEALVVRVEDALREVQAELGRLRGRLMRVTGYAQREKQCASLVLPRPWCVAQEADTAQRDAEPAPLLLLPPGLSSPSLLEPLAACTRDENTGALTSRGYYKIAGRETDARHRDLDGGCGGEGVPDERLVADAADNREHAANLGVVICWRDWVARGAWGGDWVGEQRGKGGGEHGVVARRAILRIWWSMKLCPTTSHFTSCIPFTCGERKPTAGAHRHKTLSRTRHSLLFGTSLSLSRRLPSCGGGARRMHALSSPRNAHLERLGAGEGDDVPLRARVVVAHADLRHKGHGKRENAVRQAAAARERLRRVNHAECCILRVSVLCAHGEVVEVVRSAVEGQDPVDALADLRADSGPLMSVFIRWYPLDVREQPSEENDCEGKTDASRGKMRVARSCAHAAPQRRRQTARRRRGPRAPPRRRRQRQPRPQPPRRSRRRLPRWRRLPLPPPRLLRRRCGRGTGSGRRRMPEGCNRICGGRTGEREKRFVELPSHMQHRPNRKQQRNCKHGGPRGICL